MMGRTVLLIDAQEMLPQMLFKIVNCLNRHLTKVKVKSTTLLFTVSPDSIFPFPSQGLTSFRYWIVPKSQSCKFKLELVALT